MKKLPLMLAAILLYLSGCMPLDMLRIPAQKEVNFSDKALLCYCDEEQPKTIQVMDQLFVLLDPDDPELRKPLVAGDFEKYAYAGGTLAVYMNLTYHVFDVDDYAYPSAAVSGSYDAWRAYMETYYHRYTIPEFEEACPQFQDCTWTVIREKP